MKRRPDLLNDYVLPLVGFLILLDLWRRGYITWAVVKTILTKDL